MTAYAGQLGNYQHLQVYNQGAQTQIVLQSSQPGQQQSQGNGLKTGAWTAPPTLFRMNGGFVLRIDSVEGQFFVQIMAGGGMQSLRTAPSLVGAQVVSLDPVEADATGSFSAMPPMEPMKSMKPMEPMEPMEPMKPMESMPPMRMQMGDMQMQMGGSSTAEAKAEKPQAKARFCSQCGTAVKPEDRFCAQCGHKLA